MLASFGRLTFDGERRQLFEGPNAVPLSPKAFRLLELLLENRPKALTKEAIQETLWPETFVSEANLAVLVSEIRRAIGDDPRTPTFVRTVYGFGYAFCGDASTPVRRRRARPAESVHRLVWGRTEFELAEGENIVGRDPDLRVSIRDPSVSRRHARIRVSGASAFLEDMDSKNGTFRGAERVGVPVPLIDGDDVRVGSVTLAFRSIPLDTSTKTQVERSDPRS